MIKTSTGQTSLGFLRASLNASCALQGPPSGWGHVTRFTVAGIDSLSSQCGVLWPPRSPRQQRPLIGAPGLNFAPAAPRWQSCASSPLRVRVLSVCASSPGAEAEPSAPQSQAQVNGCPPTPPHDALHMLTALRGRLRKGERVCGNVEGNPPLRCLVGCQLLLV